MKKLPIFLFIFIAAATASFAQSSTAAKAELKRLTDLNKRLAAIPSDKQDRPPYKAFIKRNDKDIVYSDPAGQWFVRSDRFWNLHKKYQRLAIADDIAWAAAQNPLPGECEGYVNCYIYKMTVTEGRYLQLYPSGKFSGKAMNTLVEYLEQVTTADSQYDPPLDAEDRADLKEKLGELKTQISGSKNAAKAKAFAAIEKLEKL